MQRLVNIPSLRSLNIPVIGNHITPRYDPKEYALQIVDAIVHCPKLELCYVGIANKCFEIIEGPIDDNSPDEGSTLPDLDDDDLDSDDEDVSGSEISEVEYASAEAIEAAGTSNSEHSPADEESEEDLELDPDWENEKILRLREILFYDDKVAIFKARHMKL